MICGRKAYNLTKKRKFLGDLVAQMPVLQQGQLAIHQLWPCCDGSMQEAGPKTEPFAGLHTFRHQLTCLHSGHTTESVRLISIKFVCCGSPVGPYPTAGAITPCSGLVVAWMSVQACLHVALWFIMVNQSGGDTPNANDSKLNNDAHCARHIWPSVLSVTEYQYEAFQILSLFVSSSPLAEHNHSEFQPTAAIPSSSLSRAQTGRNFCV